MKQLPSVKLTASELKPQKHAAKFRVPAMENLKKRFIDTQEGNSDRRNL